MMNRRRFIAGVITILAAPFAAEAQQPGKRWRIGFISSLASTSGRYQADGFVRGLRELGYEEGRNLAIEYRWAEGDYNRLSNQAKELVGLNPDLILCGGPPGPHVP